MHRVTTNCTLHLELLLLPHCPNIPVLCTCSLAALPPTLQGPRVTLQWRGHQEGVKRCTDDGTITLGWSSGHPLPVVFTNTGSITVMSSAVMTWRHYLTSPQHRQHTQGETSARTSFVCGGLSYFLLLIMENAILYYPMLLFELMV